MPQNTVTIFSVKFPCRENLSRTRSCACVRMRMWAFARYARPCACESACACVSASRAFGVPCAKCSELGKFWKICEIRTAMIVWKGDTKTSKDCESCDQKNAVFSSSSSSLPQIDFHLVKNRKIQVRINFLTFPNPWNAVVRCETTTVEWIYFFHRRNQQVNTSIRNDLTRWNDKTRFRI